MRDARRQLVEAQNFVKGRVLHDAIHQREMHRVAGFFRDHVAQQRLADQRQIADQIQRLVAAAFVCEAQAAGIQDRLAIEAHGVFERRAANQTHVAHLVELIFETEGARRRDLGGVALRRDFDFEHLPSDQRMIGKKTSQVSRKRSDGRMVIRLPPTSTETGLRMRK